MGTTALLGYISDAGELRVQMPKGVPAGTVRVRVEIVEPNEAAPSTSLSWTTEEIREILAFRPLSGAEIVAAGLAGTWNDLDIVDSVTWVDDLRQRVREERWL